MEVAGYAPANRGVVAGLNCLIEAALRYGIEVLLPCAMSNHHHTVIYDRHGRYPEFVEHFRPCVFDGFTLELSYDSGRRERHMFAISTDSKHVFARLDGTIMTKK